MASSYRNARHQATAADAVEFVCRQCGFLQLEDDLRIVEHALPAGGKHRTAYCGGCGAYLRHLPQGEPDRIHYPKHQGELVAEVARTDPDYLKFILTLPRAASHGCGWRSSGRLSSRPMRRARTLVADHDQTVAFFGSLFAHAEPGGFVSLRGFRDDRTDAPPFAIEAVPITDTLDGLIDRAWAFATGAAQATDPIVCCTPIATFRSDRARGADLHEGLASVLECDKNPRVALDTARRLLGPPTCVVASGGAWTDPTTGTVEDKLHIYHRLSEPARTAGEHAMLRRLRCLLCDLVGADPTATSPVHPLRWPGSWHRKKTPRLARILEANDTEIDVRAALEELEGLAAMRGTHPDRPRASGTGDGMDAADLLRCALLIPNDAGTEWGEWNRMGLAFYRASAGSDEGFAAFDAFSRRSGKHDPRTTRARWDHYHRSPPSRIGAGTLVFNARIVSPGFRPAATPALDDLIWEDLQA